MLITVVAIILTIIFPLVVVLLHLTLVSIVRASGGAHLGTRMAYDGLRGLVLEVGWRLATEFFAE